ncbi:outer membrane beta-barrel protein [Qipengyuania sp. XHP0211]|uniref:outer membrane beta-barrel protein n=1 Tax=Qipengyuania sp. XHP0211 TaxID=3038079 RepID=UPI00241C7573|nr:outer membrane beta-barrel protein [Qipengyuania sp. XHP0211]MDG5750418.1 outer membrane beta-barrel protein [Qipengyuania sp. XHP0211]
MASTRARSLAALAAALPLLAIPASLAAQTTIAPIIAAGDPEYQIQPITAGPFRLEPQLLAQTYYDSNVLAEEDNEIEDVEFILRPELAASLGNETARLRIEGYVQLSRFTDLTTENSDTYGVSLASLFSPRTGSAFTAGAGFARLAEDRGDPEARELAGPGPRLIDTVFANAGYRKEDGRILLDIDAEVREYDAVAAIDRERDFLSYSSRAVVGYRVGGALYATVGGFVNKRDFRLEGTALEPDRDAVTYGGRLGVRWIGEGPVRGSAAVGLFRFDPQDARLDARTGLSIAASVSALPTRRIAVVLDGFRGDVATFRQGASARTDTRVALTVQQEIRHNLFARYGASWRESTFVGSGVSEETFGPNVAVEYLFNRNLSLIADATYRKRSSDDPFDDFERFRAGLTLRMRI